MPGRVPRRCYCGGKRNTRKEREPWNPCRFHQTCWPGMAMPVSRAGPDAPRGAGIGSSRFEQSGEKSSGAPWASCVRWAYVVIPAGPSNRSLERLPLFLVPVGPWFCLWGTRSSRGSCCDLAIVSVSKGIVKHRGVRSETGESCDEAICGFVLC
jgi:hypothetical protein